MSAAFLPKQMCTTPSNKSGNMTKHVAWYCQRRLCAPTVKRVLVAPFFFSLSLCCLLMNIGQCTGRPASRRYTGEQRRNERTFRQSKLVESEGEEKTVFLLSLILYPYYGGDVSWWSALKCRTLTWHVPKGLQPGIESIGPVFRPCMCKGARRKCEKRPRKGGKPKNNRYGYFL